MHFTLTAALAITSFLGVAMALPSPNPNDNPTPAALTKRYVPGPCGAHITQYQKYQGDPHQDLSQYRIDVALKDAVGDIIGGIRRATAAPEAAVNIYSELPYVFEVIVGNVDKDSISFAYAGEHWASSSGQCAFGGFEDGNREDDCGFTCK